MGNGASARGTLVNRTLERPETSGGLRSPAVLARELKEKDEFLQRKDAELQYRMKAIEEKDSEIEKLRREIHELKCVVQQTAKTNSEKMSILSTVHEDGTIGAQRKLLGARISRKEKRQAVSGESCSKTNEFSKIELERHPKDFRYVKM